MDQLTEKEIRAFVGSKSDYYFEKWLSALDGKGKPIGNNWAAFFLSGFWIPYRKMYRTALIFFGAIMLESLLEQLLFVSILGKPQAPTGIDQAVTLVVAIICGQYGNQWYLSHARKVISEVRSQGLPEEEYLRELSKRGGTNLLAGFGFIAAFIVAVFLMLFVLNFFHAGT